MNIRIDGNDDLERALDRLSKNARDLNGQHQVPIDELLAESFLSKHCRFSSFDSLVRSSGLSQGSGGISKEEFKAIPDHEWNEWISKVTDFPDWNSMIDAAGREYFSRRMFEGI